ncbi:hypothetical protein L218DRAFT_16136 [Marasmius fiardii PR-910]|nr:hypothetical protein L218DRAFT_16136 [Marasmius fiardii PR-910]
MQHAACFPRIYHASLSFSNVLQSAASHAWCRTLSSTTPRHNSRLPSSRPSTFSAFLRHDNTNQTPFPTPQERRVGPTLSATTILPDLDTLNISQNSENVARYLQEDSSMTHPGRIPIPSSCTSKTDVSAPRTRQHGWAHHTYTTQSTSRHLSQPDSRKSLYRRLSQLHSRGINLPKLIDYHDRYSRFRSTRSFNFLISVALRHVSFGTVQWLFRSMESAKVPHTSETRKLIIRWYVATGLWDRAWRELNQETEKNVGVTLDADSQTQSGVGAGASSNLSEALWIEFFRGLHRGVKFKRLVHPTDSARTQPCNPVLLYARRFVVLMENRPVFQKSTRPKVLHFVIHALLQMKEREDAILLTRTYLDYISRHSFFLRSLTQQFPINLVHLFVAFGSSQRGLQKFHEARQLLMSFLVSYSFLSPTSTTLFLLLGTLKSARRCGTVGLECFVFFKRKWGKRVDDDRVRRRLASLAVKEGRMDIVESILKTATPPSPLANRQTLGKGHGRQKSLWIRLLARRNRRIRNMMISGSGRITKAAVRYPQRSESGDVLIR